MSHVAKTLPRVFRAKPRGPRRQTARRPSNSDSPRRRHVHPEVVRGRLAVASPGHSLGRAGCPRRATKGIRDGPRNQNPRRPRSRPGARLMSIHNLLQALSFTLTAVTSVAALAIALFGTGAALERWLDRPSPTANGARARLAVVDREAPTPIFDQDADTDAA